jgi:excisionase family DNA binding protein
VSISPKAQSPIEPLLTKRDAARLLACCTRTIDNLTRAGRLPVVRIGVAVRFDPADVKRLIDTAKA